MNGSDLPNLHFSFPRKLLVVRAGFNRSDLIPRPKQASRDTCGSQQVAQFDRRLGIVSYFDLRFIETRSSRPEGRIA